MSSLTAYWIASLFRHSPSAPEKEMVPIGGPIGFGVTARSLEDAISIIRAMDYGRYLPDDPADLSVTEGVTTADLDQLHVVPNMGPIVVRGMWYPFVSVGVPRWVEERLL